MSNKQENTHRNAKGVLIEQSGVRKHLQPVNGWPINQQKTQKEGLLSNQKCKNMFNPLKGGQ